MKIPLPYILALILLATTGHILAAELPADRLVIMPAKKEVMILPGEEKTATFTLVNNLKQSVQIRIKVEEFSQSVDGRSMSIDDLSNPYSLKSYLSLSDSSFLLGAGDSREIRVRLNLPASVPPGSRRAAIVFEQAVTPRGGQAVFSNRLAALLLVNIGGAITETGELTAFKYNRTNSHFTFSFKNEGNSYLNPYGQIIITPLFSRSRYLPVDPWFVLPGDERIRDLAWTDGGFGVYRATLELNRGYQNIVDQKTIWIWRLPWYLAGAGVLVVAGLILYILKRRQQ